MRSKITILSPRRYLPLEDNIALRHALKGEVQIPVTPSIKIIFSFAFPL